MPDDDVDDLRLEAEPVSRADAEGNAKRGPVYAQPSAVNDQATSQDSLGFDVYVKAIADFLLDPATRAPFTLSIEGPSGSGKSSFLLQLRRRIRSQSHNSVAIDFNASKDVKQDKLWAAFALAVSSALRQSAKFPRRDIGQLHLDWSRLKSSEERAKLFVRASFWAAFLIAFLFAVQWSKSTPMNARADVIQRSIINPLVRHVESPAKKLAPVAFPSSSTGPATPNAGTPIPPKQSPAKAASSGLRHWISVALANSEWVTGFILIAGLILHFPDRSRKSPLEINLENYIDRPDYAGKAAFVHTFADDFAQLVETYAPKPPGRIFVFIDDLDKCEAPKAADLIQAMNTMIGEGGQLFFVMGFDRSKVAASVAYKFRKTAVYLASARSDADLKSVRDPKTNIARIRTLGDEFLDKFIQLSFRIPTPNKDEQNAEYYMESMIRGRVNANPRLTWFQRFLHTASSDPTPSVAESSSPQPNRIPYRIESGPESEQVRSILVLAREIFDFNPRRLKIFLNQYRLSLNLASRQGLFDLDPDTGSPEVTPEQVGKFIALTTVHPELLDGALQDCDFFRKLEFFLIWKRSLTSDSEKVAAEWASKPGVRQLLLPKGVVSTEWRRTFSLAKFPVERFVGILPEQSTPSEESLARMKAADGLRRSDLLVGERDASDVETFIPVEIEKAVEVPQQQQPNVKFSPAAQPPRKKRVRRSRKPPTAAA